jgi:hypothetical protein
VVISVQSNPSDERWVCIYSYKCYWALPALSLSSPSPSELVTISYWLIWDWVSFLSALTISRAMVEVLQTTFTQGPGNLDSLGLGPTHNTGLNNSPTVVYWLHWSHDLVPTETCLQTHCPAMALCAGSTIPALRECVTIPWKNWIDKQPNKLRKQKNITSNKLQNDPCVTYHFETNPEVMKNTT